jgi:citrate lyase beta subunit
VVGSVLTDILTTFADAYVVSAPVCEYYQCIDGDDQWAKCLESEIEMDFANGFIGKTIIHPSQLPIVRRSLQPLRTDYKDALQILHWNGGAWGVVKSVAGNRMNEVATHYNWARKILIMSEIYGVRD